MLVAGLTLAVGAEAAGEGVEVAIPGRLYAPGELDALAGQTVTWRNADSTSHTVSSEDDAFDSGYLSSGSTFSHTFSSTGTFPYFCRIHRTMRGVVRVYALILNGPPLPLPPAWAVSFRGVSPAPGEAVVLERRSGRGFVSVGQAVSAADGSFVFSQRPLGADGLPRARRDGAEPGRPRRGQAERGRRGVGQAHASVDRTLPAAERRPAPALRPRVVRLGHGREEQARRALAGRARCAPGRRARAGRRARPRRLGRRR